MTDHQPLSQHPFKSRSVWRSFGYALNGLRAAFAGERNFRIHTALTVAVAAAGFYFQVSRAEWALLVLCITLMLSVEALNTALEYMVDAWADGVFNEKAKLVKDIAAAACLMTALGCSLVGWLVFWPYVAAQLVGPSPF